MNEDEKGIDDRLVGLLDLYSDFYPMLICLVKYFKHILDGIHPGYSENTKIDMENIKNVLSQFQIGVPKSRQIDLEDEIEDAEDSSIIFIRDFLNVPTHYGARLPHSLLIIIIEMIIISYKMNTLNIHQHFPQPFFNNYSMLLYIATVIINENYGMNITSQYIEELMQNYFNKPISCYEGNGDCAICMEPLISENPRLIGQLSCNHCFHKDCLETWIGEGPYDVIHNTCPVCVKRIMFKEMMIASSDRIVFLGSGIEL